MENKMKISTNLKLYALILLFTGAITSQTACKVKEGCGTENMGPKLDKEGRLSKERGKSRLFE